MLCLCSRGCGSFLKSNTCLYYISNQPQAFMSRLKHLFKLDTPYLQSLQPSSLIQGDFYPLLWIRLLQHWWINSIFTYPDFIDGCELGPECTSDSITRIYQELLFWEHEPQLTLPWSFGPWIANGPITQYMNYTIYKQYLLMRQAFQACTLNEHTMPNCLHWNKWGVILDCLLCILQSHQSL